MPSKGPHAKTMATRLWNYWKMKEPIGDRVKQEKVMPWKGSLERDSGILMISLSLSLYLLCICLSLSLSLPSPVFSLHSSSSFPFLFFLASMLNNPKTLWFCHKALSLCSCLKSRTWFKTFGVISQNNLFFFVNLLFKCFAAECWHNFKGETTLTLKFHSFSFW